jgi:hypothetical protein
LRDKDFIVALRDKEPFIVGDRVKVRGLDAFTGLPFATATITKLVGNIAMLDFDCKNLGELGWRIERLEFESVVDLGDEYFA